eukprot:SAG22_NODE_5660_length_975_cov_1.410959_2_plen_171_part_01
MPLTAHVIMMAASTLLLLGLSLGAAAGAHALAAGVELQSGFVLDSPVPVGTTYCHGGPGEKCYCNPQQKPAAVCIYSGTAAKLPCPQCGTSNCTCPPAPPAPGPPGPPPAPPGPAPPSIPVGTISNGTCVPAPYHGSDCNTHASGYFSGLASLAACAAKVKPCKMGNYVSY